LVGAKEVVARTGKIVTVPPPKSDPERLDIIDTAIRLDDIQDIADSLTQVPTQFTLNPKVVTLLSRRAKMTRGEAPVDWGMAEALAFSSLVLEGTPVRL